MAGAKFPNTEEFFNYVVVADTFPAGWRRLTFVPAQKNRLLYSTLMVPERGIKDMKEKCHTKYLIRFISNVIHGNFQSLPIRNEFETPERDSRLPARKFKIQGPAIMEVKTQSSMKQPLPRHKAWLEVHDIMTNGFITEAIIREFLEPNGRLFS